MAYAWLGVDPGGRDAFGLAILHMDGTLKSICVSCAEEALSWIDEEPLGVGIDAPMWWSAGPSGDRKADQWIRKTYRNAARSVQASNSLRGAALLQAAVFSERLRHRYPNVRITEVHPKALILALGGLEQFLGKHDIVVRFDSEHVRDAAIAAVAAREGFTDRWPRDLAKDRLSSEQDPTSYWLAPMHYFWPE